MFDRAYELAERLIARLERLIELLERLERERNVR
jgi:hypothetical protein